MHWFRSVLLLAVCGGTTVAGESPPSGRILYLTPAQPLVLEVVVIHNGRPLASTLDELLRVEFQRLDENGDGRLSVSEQKRLPSRKVLQSVGLIAWDEPAEQVASQTAAEDIADVSALRRRYEELGVTLVRMYDGDVSCREFPGTDEQFRRLDADADGLIDHAEAEAARGGK